MISSLSPPLDGGTTTANSAFSWWLQAWRRSMDDLAETIDDLICTFDGSSDTTMDTVAMYLFGWLVIGLSVLGIGRFVYGKVSGKLWGTFSDNSTSEKQDKTSEQTKQTVGLQNSEVTEAPIAVSAPILTSAPRSGYVPPTPPVRKRLGSKTGRASVGPVVKSKSGSASHPPPVATGAESESVRWVTEFFAWLYSDLVVVNEMLNVWIQSLNDSTKQSVTEHGVGVEFVRVLNESPAPSINNMFCECDPKDDVTITCDCEVMPALQIKVFRQKGEKVEVSHYRLNVNRFRARLHILAISEKLSAEVRCDGWPEIKVALAQVGAIKSNNLDEMQLQDVICDIVTSALRSTELHFNFIQYPTCPRLTRNFQQPQHLLPVHYDSILSAQQDKSADKRLLVKVIKAQGLGSTQGCIEPYCVVEIDEPAQKNQTSIKKETNNPIWEEHFLFDITKRTSEILLEIYDRNCGDETKFLGLGIVSMDELIISPNQRQVISLQATPWHENIPVSGTLTVEFLLIDGPDLPVTADKPFKLKETLRSVSPAGAILTTTKTVFAQNQDKIANGTDNVTEIALRDLEKNKSANLPSKSTLIIHSVHRTPQLQVVKVEMTETGKWLEVLNDKGMKDEFVHSTPKPTDGELKPEDPPERSRSRRRRRDFFGTLRQRLSRSKIRSKSVGPPLDPNETATDDTYKRSISADRRRDPSAHSTTSIGSYLSVPGLRGDSARSSLSEASGISGASSRTYINEASTLVLETIENGIKKYYLVPLSLAQRNRWRKKGNKLHIFNDHTFVAKHLTGGTMCQVCRKGLARRLGKQGYECRDCQYICHKQCHIKVELTCPSSTIHLLELSSATSASPRLSRVNSKKLKVS